MPSLNRKVNNYNNTHEPTKSVSIPTIHDNDLLSNEDKIQPPDPILPSSTILFKNVSLARTKTEQSQDPDLSCRILAIRENSDRHSDEMIEDDVLFKLIHHKEHTTLELPWIPISWISTILSAYNDHPLSGHSVITRTYHKIRNQYYWIDLYDSVKNHIRSCATCAPFNV
jgi:hypothetical protein